MVLPYHCTMCHCTMCIDTGRTHTATQPHMQSIILLIFFWLCIVRCSFLAILRWSSSSAMMLGRPLPPATGFIVNGLPVHILRTRNVSHQRWILIIQSCWMTVFELKRFSFHYAKRTRIIVLAFLRTINIRRSSIVFCLVRTHFISVYCFYILRSLAFANNLIFFKMPSARPRLFLLSISHRVFAHFISIAGTQLEISKFLQVPFDSFLQLSSFILFPSHPFLNCPPHSCFHRCRRCCFLFPICVLLFSVLCYGDLSVYAAANTR